jgi:hypothetical protein
VCGRRHVGNRRRLDRRRRRQRGKRHVRIAKLRRHERRIHAGRDRRWQIGDDHRLRNEEHRERFRIDYDDEHLRGTKHSGRLHVREGRDVHSEQLLQRLCVRYNNAQVRSSGRLSVVFFSPIAIGALGAAIACSRAPAPTLPIPKTAASVAPPPPVVVVPDAGAPMPAPIVAYEPPLYGIPIAKIN